MATPSTSELESQIALQERMNELLRQQTEMQKKSTEQTRTQSDVQSSFFSVFESGSSSTEKAAAGQQDLAGALDDVANSQKDVGEQTNYVEKAMLFLGKAQKTVSAGFKSMMDVMKPLYSFIMLNPVYNMLAKNLGNVKQAQMGAFEAAQQFKETLGTLPKTVKKFNKFMSESSKTIGETGRSLSSIAGIEYGDVTKKFLGYAGEMGVGFDHFMEKAQGAYGEIILFKEGLGLSMDALEDMTYRFGEASFGDFATMLVGGADDLGLSLQNVSKNFAAGIKDSSNFGYMTRKELTATSLYATKLGMEMSELTSFGDKFDTFEGAAESVGKLSAAFGIQLDTMDLVMEDNPAKKLDMVREALEKSGKSMDDILGDRRQAKYLADSLGLPIAQLEKLASISSDEFGFTDAMDSAVESQEDMTELDAMKAISEQMRQLNTALNPMNNSAKTFFGSFVAGFTDASEAGGVFKELTLAMKEALDSFYAVGQQVYNLTSDLFRNAKNGEAAGPLNGMVKPFFDYFKQMEGVAAKLIGEPGYKGTDEKRMGVLKNVFNYIGEFLSGDGVVSSEKNIFHMLLEPFKDVDKPSLLTPGIKKGLVNIAKLLVDSLASAFRFIGDKALSWVGKLLDTTSQSFDKGGNGKSMVSFAKKMFSSIGDMLGDLVKAAGGMSALFVGGSFNGKNYSYEESIIGRIMTDTSETMSETNVFGDILGNLIGGVAGMFGNSDLAKAFQSGGVGLGEKFEFAFLVMKSSALKAMAEMSRSLAKVGQEGLDSWTSANDGDSPGYVDMISNPGLMIMKSLASLGDSPGGDTISGKLAQMAFKAEKEVIAAQANIAAATAKHLESFDSSGRFQESMPGPDLGESIASDLNEGLAKGLTESMPYDEINAFGIEFEESLRDAEGVKTNSPSLAMYGVGVDMADGLIAGFFGNEGLIAGSEETGFIKKFDREMIAVGEMIESAYGDISRAAVMSIETKLGRVGEILSGNKPLSVVVDNKKLQIQLAVNVVMDTNDVASGIASAAGGSYFLINTNGRDSSAENFRPLEISNEFGESAP